MRNLRVGFHDSHLLPTQHEHNQQEERKDESRKPQAAAGYEAEAPHQVYEGGIVKHQDEGDDKFGKAAR